MVRSTILIALILICSPLYACENGKTDHPRTQKKKSRNPLLSPAHGYWVDWDWENPDTVREEKEALEKIQKTKLLLAELLQKTASGSPQNSTGHLEKNNSYGNISNIIIDKPKV